MVFLKLVPTEYQVNHKTQPSWVKVVHLTPHHILVISNLILAKNKKIQCGNKYLVFSTVLKWRVVVGAKWMVPTACPARV